VESWLSRRRLFLMLLQTIAWDGDIAKVQGKRKMPPHGEDITDLLALHGNLPTDQEGIRQACEALRGDIVQHRKREEKRHLRDW